MFEPKPRQDQGRSRQPSVLLDLSLNVVAPSWVLESLSAPERLGPRMALMVALLLPLLFMLHCLVRGRRIEAFSVLGFAAVVISGGLGLLELEAGWFALKEAAFPLILGLAFPLSQRLGRNLTRDLLLNPQVINRPLLEASLQQDAQRQSAFQLILWRASWVLALVLGSGALLNAWMIVSYLGDSVPGSQEYVRAIGRQSWMSLLVLGLPTVLTLMGLMVWLLGQLERRCGIARHDLLRPRS